MPEKNIFSPDESERIISVDELIKNIQEGYSIAAAMGFSKEKLEAVYATGYQFFNQGKYEKARKIIADKNIKSKESYYELCERDNRLSKEPEIDFKGQFANWIEYLSIERVYYDLETCKNKVVEYLALYNEIKKCHKNSISYVAQDCWH